MLVIKLVYENLGVGNVVIRQPRFGPQKIKAK
jgi:hypothetical protein